MKSVTRPDDLKQILPCSRVILLKETDLRQLVAVY